jgi:beta-ureidopropionase / N-carbamoyl-L-amino-acid hydrolase
MEQSLRAAIAEASHDSGLEIGLEMVSSFKPCVFDAGCVSAVERAAANLGYSHMPAISGAGHDAVNVARVAPAAMIFIPCKDGISHNEIEDAKPEHIEAGCNVLLHAMLERAGVA